MGLVDIALQEERCWFVYVHINKINGKKYVGITSKPPEDRWGNEGYRYRNQPFYRAIKKYGWDNFDHEIIASNLTREEANNFEKKLIEELNTHINNGYGYNSTMGGDGILGHHHSEETKEKMRACKIGIKFSDEHRRKIGESNRGKTHSEESKIKMSLSRMGNVCPTRRKVTCGGLEFDSIQDCAIYYGEKQDTMNRWLLGKNKMPQKFIDLNLQYYGEHREYEVKSECGTTAKKVVCQGMMFDSIKCCAEYYKINASTMMSWLKGNTRMPKKFIDFNLQYFGENINYEEQVDRRNSENNKRFTKVICENKIYNSISQCARAYGENSKTMGSWLSCARKMPQKFIDLGLMYYDDYIKLNKEMEVI